MAIISGTLQDLTPPKAIIFDWDGTLTSTEALFKNSLGKTFQHMGCPEKMPTEMPAISSKDFFHLIFGERAGEAESFYYECINQRHLVEMTVIEGIPSFLDYLQGTGIPLYILSNKRGPVLRREVTHLGWDTYFEKVVGSQDAPLDKPSPLSVDYVFEGTPHFGGPQVWFVGDTYVDMQCAAAIGATPVLISPLSADQVETGEGRPKIVVEKCGDLQNILSRIV